MLEEEIYSAVGDDLYFLNNQVDRILYVNKNLLVFQVLMMAEEVGIVDINNASVKDLETLFGVGRAKAEAIHTARMVSVFSGAIACLCFNKLFIHTFMIVVMMLLSSCAVTSSY